MWFSSKADQNVTQGLGLGRILRIKDLSKGK
jgi:hypothetical protein